MSERSLSAFQKVALACLISVMVLIFVGAIVRVTGAGLGCPDWPKCWGCLIPPTSIEQVDFEALDIERFQRKAARHGRDPSEITVEALRAEFNPVHVWTEFINRLFSLPVGFSSLALFIMAFWERPKRPIVFWCSFFALFLVLLNAWLGARVVYSGLKPGTITTHMSLAILLQAVLVFTAWKATDQPWRIPIKPQNRKVILSLGLVLFVVTIAEMIMGAQIREMTDEMAKEHKGEDRADWIGELEAASLYLAHRSFSWVILGATLLWAFWIKNKDDRSLNWVEKAFVTIVLIQMVLGVVMSHFAIYRWVQVLHVGLASFMVVLLVLWNLASWRKE